MTRRRGASRAASAATKPGSSASSTLACSSMSPPPNPASNTRDYRVAAANFALTRRVRFEAIWRDLRRRGSSVVNGGPVALLGARLFRRALGEDALQGAAVHVEPARGFRDVAAAQFVDALNVLPAHAIRRHRIFRRLDLPVVERKQRRRHVVGIDR